MGVHLNDGMAGGDHELPCPGVLRIHIDRTNLALGCLVTCHDVHEGPMDPLQYAAEELHQGCLATWNWYHHLTECKPCLGGQQCAEGAALSSAMFDKATAALLKAKTPKEQLPVVQRLLAGHAITREHAHAVVAAIQGGAVTRTLLPANVLLWDGLRLAWWTPSRRRRIWFDPQEKRHLQHVSRQEVLHPALVWVAERDRLHVYALAENARPEADTPVYQAPYCNLYPDGWVCPGSAKLPKLLAPDQLAHWEQFLLESAGTKVWAAELTRFPGGHDALWPAMREAEEFPAASLVPTGRTLLDVLNYVGPRTYPNDPPVEVVVPAAEALPR